MKSFFKIVLPAFAIAASGCATRPHLRPAQNRLQRSVTYTEITDSGKEIPLTKTNNGQTFIPDYAEVDINSTIEIHIDNDLRNSSSSAVDIDQKTVQLHEALSLLANVIEALIGALYLDRGYEPAAEFIKKEILIELPSIIKEGSYMDPKSKLQELVQEKKGITPTYGVVSESGPDHDKVFVVAAFVNTQEIGRGTGPSKQEAEISAAEDSLVKNQF
jgi:hypothetical protein